MGYLTVFLLMGGSAVAIKFFVDRGTGTLAGLVTALPIRIVYLLVLVAIADNRRLAETSLHGVIGGLISIILLGFSALFALRFFGTRTAIVIGIAVWALSATVVATVQRGS